MKFLSVLASALTVVSALAVPLSGSVAEERDLVERAKVAKFKLSSPPAVGKSGVFKDATTGITHIHYGDDMKVHGSHVEYHNTNFPQHAGKVFKSAGGNRKSGQQKANTDAALKGIKSQGTGWVRDEKPLASLDNPSGKVSVMKAPRTESNIEAHLARIAKHSNKGGNGIMLHDNRSTKNTGPLGTILKKRDLELARRGIIDSISNGVDDIKNKTESVTGSVTSLTNITSELEKEFDSFQTKLTGLIKGVVDDLQGADQDLITAVEQIMFSDSHQLGPFYQGTTNYDDVNTAMAANGTKISDDVYTAQAASTEVYLSAYQNATTSIGASVMDDFWKLTNTILGMDSDDDDGGDSDPATDLFETYVSKANNGKAGFTLGDNSTAAGNTTTTKTDDGCENSTSTRRSITRRGEVKLPL